MKNIALYSILLLENNTDNLEILTKNLDRNQYEVNTLFNVSISDFSKIANNIDMLIVGEEFHNNVNSIIQAIRLRSKIIPIIFIVKKHDEKEITQYLEMGVDGFIFAPINPTTMKSKIKHFSKKYEQLYQKFDEKLQNIRGNISMVMPHEFRTSLSGILGLAKTISQISHQKAYLSQGEIQEVNEMSNFILNSGTYLSRITENFLLYSNLQLIKYNPEIEKEAVILHNCSEIIFDIVHSLTNNTSRAQDIELNLMNASILISHLHFQKIIYELIDNALKFSAVKSCIKIISFAKAKTYTIIISDEGRGICKTQIDQIDAFKQFDRNLYEQQGTGLGLIIAKELTEVNMGVFHIESSLDTGTVIRLEFPIYQNYESN